MSERPPRTITGGQTGECAGQDNLSERQSRWNLLPD
jgi:hypothetical protein